MPRTTIHSTSTYAATNATGRKRCGSWKRSKRKRSSSARATSPASSHPSAMVMRAATSTDSP
ncbi:hypothetical protein E2C04_07440 [Nocardioides daphniae]|uniref:Uncharacterized protein n=1 Tax=Nocardioides daphniae TaxID=402297 RepID=A0A4P7UAX2_9ACTN|nr:hypothetical protein E2C04_07440 [Nocardioides daphniae]